MIKPDGVARGLENEIFKRVENAGLNVEVRQKMSLTAEQAAELYKPHLDKPFYPGLIKFITSGAVVACVVSGESAIGRLRALMGATDPMKAEAGTIRGDLREEIVLSEYGTIKNLVHGSDSPESAEREIAIFFK
ncbi:nucleoside-diphosphate kinase [candidate division WOR-1 bacterium RIFCSPHIGHO2_01_FULL_53_15]|uniref:Nucleoside diphosphate kinase n=1 Tax=candidate division WOR-1 bacterium RIFCSPHIGHO2_01_FULL_53_15 TaxID=1802564 RepID=A0A1F4Q127_UNCSA|nr:MAG: nucleoside-diphosphate kinase [candidate division WOR-1 bacterium RIFCSPHIGHO2_01_FULL_53_15]OGC13855.1 MAG: nucleoside-diphosphate kinase [candidate division WOR-1 bacterium RIFCSPHIGHO2_02_FULL_53_26]